jgi:hypothetical protein
MGNELPKEKKAHVVADAEPNLENLPEQNKVLKERCEHILAECKKLKRKNRILKASLATLTIGGLGVAGVLTAKEIEKRRRT